VANIKITGLDKIQKKFSNPKNLITDSIDSNGGIEVKCPNCHKKIKVTSNGTTCSCGQKINFDLQ